MFLEGLLNNWEVSSCTCIVMFPIPKTKSVA